MPSTSSVPVDVSFKAVLRSVCGMCDQSFTQFLSSLFFHDSYNIVVRVINRVFSHCPPFFPRCRYNMLLLLETRERLLSRGVQAYSYGEVGRAACGR